MRLCPGSNRREISRDSGGAGRFRGGSGQEMEVSCRTGNANPAQAALASVAAATNAPDASTAEGEVDSVRYGHPLRARKLVGVRGAGLTHDGFWFVRRVTHTLERGEYTQRFSLSREGGTSITPVVRP